MNAASSISRRIVDAEIKITGISNQSAGKRYPDLLKNKYIDTCYVLRHFHIIMYSLFVVYNIVTVNNMWNN